MKRLTIVAVFVVACTSDPSPSFRAPPPPTTFARMTPQIRFVPAGDGDLAERVRTFVVEARAEGRTPLVYVGASWCEPCGYFHRAAEHGDLDAELPPLALLELDHDRDGARIEAAGYETRMIPSFTVPAEDGRASDRHIEGSIHGPGSPMEITPRLIALIDNRS